MCRNFVFSLWKLIIIVINYAISDHMRKWYFIFFPLFLPPPLFLTCLDCTLAPFNPNDFVKKKKKALLSSNFSFNWSLWELGWAHKAHAIAFQKSRVHQDHFLTSKSWMNAKKEYHILTLFSRYWSPLETGNWAKKGP